MKFVILVFLIICISCAPEKQEKQATEKALNKELPSKRISFAETQAKNDPRPVDYPKDGVMPEGGDEIHDEKIKVQSYYGDYDVSHKKSGIPAPSLKKEGSHFWQSPKKALRPYRLAVLFPHLKDPFWVAVNYGMTMEAKKYGLSMELWHAGGYRELGKQAIQLQYVLENHHLFDGVIIGAVQFKKEKLESLYKKFEDINLPIISVINDSYSPTITAKSIVSWRDLGYQAGKFLVEDSKGKEVKVLIFPGPAGTGWAPDSLDGFKQALTDFDPNKRVKVLSPIWGDTGDKAQRHLLNYILPQHENVDYLVANALAANAYFTESIEGQKAPMLMHKQRHPNLKVISTYITQDVYQHIKNKRILASPTDLMKQQGMIAIDLMIYHLNQKESGKKHKYPFRVGPIVPIIHQDNIKDWSYELLFGRRDYKAVYKLKEKSK